MKRRAVAVVIGLLSTTAGCGIGDDESVGKESERAPYHITLEGEASGAVDFIKYTDTTGAQVDATPPTVPFLKQITLDPKAIYVQVVVGATIVAGATSLTPVSCRITVDGQVVSERRSEGVVDCSSNLPVKKS
jgi:hypothetical protein